MSNCDIFCGMKRAWKKITAGLILVFGLAATMLAIYRDNVFVLRHIDVVIENKNDLDEKLTTVWIERLQEQLRSQVGKALFQIDLDEIQKKIAKEDWVVNSAIRKSWPDTVVIQLLADKVVLSIVMPKGKIAPVSERGIILKPVESNIMPDVPMLVGEGMKKSLPLRQSAVLMLQDLPMDGRLGKSQIAEIGFEDHHGFWARTLDRDAQIFLGREEFHMRANRVEQVMNYLDQRQIEARVIDAGLTKKVLVRLRKAP